MLVLSTPTTIIYANARKIIKEQSVGIFTCFQFKNIRNYKTYLGVPGSLNEREKGKSERFTGSLSNKTTCIEHKQTFAHNIVRALSSFPLSLYLSSIEWCPDYFSWFKKIIVTEKKNDSNCFTAWICFRFVTSSYNDY